jgi:hypothetical protein
MGQPTHKDDVKAGVPLTTTMMTVAAIRTTVGGGAEIPDGVGDKFEAPLKRDEAEFHPSGVTASPPLGSGSAGGGGVGTPTTGPDNHRNPDGGKIKEGTITIGGEDGRCNFKRA